MTQNTRAKQHVARARELSSSLKAPRLTKAKETAIISKVRKDREEIFLSRHKDLFGITIGFI